MMRGSVVVLVLAAMVLTVAEGQDCPEGCPRHYDPVCGSDGKTYGNLCVLEAEQCVNPELRLVSKGPCPGAEENLDTLPGRVQVYEECPMMCTAQYDPVCGSDGKTYGNLCELQVEAECNNKPDLHAVSKGECMN